MRKPCPLNSKRRTAVIVGAWITLIGLALFQGCGFGRLSKQLPQQQRQQQPTFRQQKHASALTKPQMPFRKDGGSKKSSSSDRPLTSNVACARKSTGPPHITPREIDLQQQRSCVLDEAGGRPPGGYLAVCAIVKNQHRELPEWLDYHQRLGVSHFYITDDGSDPPLDAVLAPYVKKGVATHRMMMAVEDAQREIRKATCHKPYIGHKQLMAYHLCLRDFGHRHQWMAFFDVDEFFVFMDNTSSLPTLLRGFEGYGGLGINWRMFGSSGHTKHQANTLRAYTKCYHPDNRENTQIKTIANMRYLARMAGPHDAFYLPGIFTVNPSGVPVTGPLSAPADYSRLVLHHYALKSRQDFEEKLARGDVMGDEGKLLNDFWNRIEMGSTENCAAIGEDMLRRFGQRGAGEEEK